MTVLAQQRNNQASPKLWEGDRKTDRANLRSKVIIH